jgi:hypothetical protein
LSSASQCIEIDSFPSSKATRVEYSRKWWWRHLEVAHRLQVPSRRRPPQPRSIRRERGCGSSRQQFGSLREEEVVFGGGVISRRPTIPMVRATLLGREDPPFPRLTASLEDRRTFLLLHPPPRRLPRTRLSRLSLLHLSRPVLLTRDEDTASVESAWATSQT